MSKQKAVGRGARITPARIRAWLDDWRCLVSGPSARVTITSQQMCWILRRLAGRPHD